jgi:hypothetical protein
MQSDKRQKTALGSEITVGLSAYGNVETTRAALRHLFNSADCEFELIVVDDCSPDAGSTRTMFQEAAGFHRNTQERTCRERRKRIDLTKTTQTGP